MPWRFIVASASARVSSGIDGDRVHHHARLVALDEAHLLGLGVRLEIAVDDAEAAVLRHGDRHLGLGHRVHGGGDDRQVEVDRLGQARRDVDVARQDLGAPGPQQHVVEGEAFDEPIGDDAGHGQLLEVKIRKNRGCGGVELARVRSMGVPVRKGLARHVNRPQGSRARVHGLCNAER